MVLVKEFLQRSGPKASTESRRPQFPALWETASADGVDIGIAAARNSSINCTH